MSYRVPSFEEAHAFAIAMWKAMWPLSNVGSRFSYHWKRLRAYAGSTTDIHAHVDSAIRDVMPDSARGPFLTRWGAIVGVDKKGATSARGTNALRVYGVAGSPVPIGAQLTHDPTGFTFQITEADVVGAGVGGIGSVDVDVKGISTGSGTRLQVNEQLTFVVNPPGVKAIAKIVVALDTDGFDEEQDPAYSVRVNDELGKPRMGGHASDFEKWALEVPGVAMAKSYPNRAGVGTMDVAAFHTGNGSSRSLTDDERAAVLAHIRKVAPAQVGATAGPLRVLKTIADPRPIEITYQPNGDQAYEPDWNDAIAPVVLLFTAPRTVQFTAAVPQSMLASKRIVFRGVGSVQDGAVFTIETLTAPDTIVLKEEPPVPLASTDVAYAGGPLTKIIRDAIIAHVNGEIVYADKGQPIAESAAGSKVNLVELAAPLGPANPGGVYGTWSGSLVRAILGKIAAYPTGARNVAIVAPAADYDATDPAFPNDATINFITPSVVLVRKG